jgi:tritrans,polycis-undecaprenyl-diphosphate synthase [geranylgeranyl-diphosphate specific]|tara:strand:- start:708 stop:1385 length:678 start_codon:yes stop_codon:yes gene_type:complete
MENVPRHVAVILDGNRRYAQENGMPKLEGHRKGIEKIGEMLQWCMDSGVRELTLYCLSTENFDRDQKEVDYLFKLLRDKIKSFSSDKQIHDNKVRIKVVGRLSLFPDDIRGEMEKVMGETAPYTDYTLNLAMAYGSRAEIVDAVKNLVESGEEITEDALGDRLYVTSDVDLLIRPGGEKRISNFLLWQNSYSEIIWVDALWPAFSKEDFDGCLSEFKNRQRRYGK